MKKRWSSILLFCLINICCAAQTAGYKFYSQLDSIKTSGFYNIALTPELSAHLKTDYSDLRIVNDSGKWVPHVLHFPEDVYPKDILRAPVKIEEKKNTNFFTEIILKSDSFFLSEFDIFIKSTNATRAAKLSGSDNNKDWFVIEDSIILEPVFTKDKVETKYHVEFPACNYKFYKVVIQNKNNDPVNVLSVSRNFSLTMYQLRFVVNNPTCKLQQMDSAKTSYIKVTQGQPYHFESFNFKISGVKYFYRKVDMYLSNGNSSFSNPGELYQSFYISNKSALEFAVPFTNAKEFFLLINNEDNLPLKIDEVKTWCKERSLTVYLEKGNSYKLILDNLAAEMPNYDLSKLDIKPSDSTPFLSPRKIIAFEEKPTITTPQKNNNWILWTAVIAALLILLLFTKKMIKEVDKRKHDDSI